MTLKIYNTISREKQTFKPGNTNHVAMYVCGVTVYDYCHIGHARTYVSADIMVRYLKWLGFTVHYVRNITDIDDKIIKKAFQNKEPYQAVTERFTKCMHEDFKALHLLQPDDEPRATEFIPAMIKLIEKIIANDHAYAAENGDVYFDVKSFPEYGYLSNHNIEQLESGSRVEVSDVKRDPLDFVLWKRAKPNEPKWPSPWGEGRPGWHIECSAMAMELLGETLDIHGGGQDLIFPHHENEIAQSKSATHKRFSNYWVHGGFLQINQDKMSKSLGNFITIREVLKDHDAEVLRYLFVASHYRSPLIYSDDLLNQAKQSLNRLYTALRFLKISDAPSDHPYKQQFTKAMNDDFNTPIALSVLFDLAHEIQRARGHDEASASSLAALLKELGSVLGILQKDPEVYFQSGIAISPEEIEQLIAARNEARSKKDWIEADRIRNQLADQSIIIEDGPHGTTWKIQK